MSEQEALPELPSHYTNLDRLLLEQIRDVWQSLLLPKPHDWARDIRGVRYYYTPSGMIVPEDDELGTEMTGRQAYWLDVNGFIFGRDDARRKKENIYKANELTRKMNIRHLVCDWWEIMDWGVDFHLRSAPANWSECSIRFDDGTERYYMPRHVYFCVEIGQDHKKLFLCRKITDDAAIEYVRAGRDEADFGPNWREQSSDPVSQSAGLAKKQSRSKHSTRPSKLAKQRGLFGGNL